MLAPQARRVQAWHTALYNTADSSATDEDKPPVYEEPVPNDGYSYIPYVAVIDGVYTEMEYADPPRIIVGVKTSWTWSKKRIFILVAFLLVLFGGITCAIIFPMGLVLKPSGGNSPELADFAVTSASTTSTTTSFSSSTTTSTSSTSISTSTSTPVPMYFKLWGAGGAGGSANSVCSLGNVGAGGGFLYFKSNSNIIPSGTLLNIYIGGGGNVPLGGFDGGGKGGYMGGGGGGSTRILINTSILLAVVGAGGGGSPYGTGGGLFNLGLMVIKTLVPLVQVVFMVMVLKMLVVVSPV